MVITRVGMIAFEFVENTTIGGFSDFGMEMIGFGGENLIWSSLHGMAMHAKCFVKGS